jgi:cytochrome b pre-mRNA-processing protein 3
VVLSKLFGRGNQDEAARKLFDAIVRQSRDPYFYTEAQVADTVEGRFDMVALHAYLILRRLKTEGEEAGALSQRLFDVMFDNFDENLRELGVGDIGIGRRIKKMASAFFGRVKAYDEALATENNEDLKQALDRNLYKERAVDDNTLAEMARYMRQQDSFLAEQAMEVFFSGQGKFEPIVDENRC